MQDEEEEEGEAQQQQQQEGAPTGRGKAAGKGKKSKGAAAGGGSPARGRKGAKGGEDGVRADAHVDADAFACEASIAVPLNAPKLLMLRLIEQAAADSLLRATPGESASRRWCRRPGCWLGAAEHHACGAYGCRSG